MTDADLRAIAEGRPIKSVCANPCFACGTAPFPTAHCVGCRTKKRVEDPFDTHFVCDACAAKYPESLLKAARDEFHYALQLRTGVIIRFSSASFHGDFVHLDFDELYAQRLPFPFHPDKVDKRGVDVRLSDIVWVADGKTVFGGEGNADE